MPRKVYQVKGNDCFSACVASILEVPVEEVPILHEVGQEGMLTYLNKKGYTLIHFYQEAWASSEWEEILNFVKSGYCIGAINTDNGKYHAVVFHNGEIWHDPDRNSKTPYPYELDCISVFVKLFNEGE